MCWWEYSLEDYFRDSINDEFGIEFKEINKYLYDKEELEELED